MLGSDCRPSKDELVFHAHPFKVQPSKGATPGGEGVRFLPGQARGGVLCYMLRPRPS